MPWAAFLNGIEPGEGAPAFVGLNLESKLQSFSLGFKHPGQHSCMGMDLERELQPFSLGWK